MGRGSHEPPIGGFSYHPLPPSKNPAKRLGCCLVEGGGFEPPKSSTTDLQSAPFGHSGTLPYVLRRRAGRGRMCVPFYTRDGVDGAGERNRTINLLITNQLLCLLSYTSRECFVPRHLSRGTVRRADGEGFVWCLGADLNHRHRDFQSLALPTELPRQAL